ncbi:chitinase, partial [Streptomyces albidoflavus]
MDQTNRLGRRIVACGAAPPGSRRVAAPARNSATPPHPRSDDLVSR